MDATYNPGETRRSTLWAATAAPGPALSTVEGENRADVVVVGAGIAGLSTALHLAEAGCAVTVIEAADLGGGATGESGGLLAPDFIRHSLTEIEHTQGREQAARLIQLVGSCARQCFELIERHNLSCDASQDGFWVPAHDQIVLASLRKRAQEWRDAGFNVECIPADETARCLGALRYCGAIRFAEGGSLNPLAFSRGLAEAAIQQGANIFSHSPVRKLVQHNSGWRVSTDGGFVDAKRVVLAANGGNAALHPGMRNTVLPLRVYEYATTPLSAEHRARILPFGGSFTDKQPYMFTARYDKAGRLIAAFPDFLINRSEKSLLKEASRRLVRHFPNLKGVSIEFLWRGTAWLNPSLLPKVYRLGEGAFAIQACNGRGLATNTVLGMEMAATLIHRNEKLLSVSPESPKKIRAHGLVRFAPALLMSLAYVNNKLSRKVAVNA